MDKILEALKNLLPAEQLNEVSVAVDEMISEAKAELEAEFESKLNEAYSELSAELATAEKVAEEGYQEAYAIINDLRNRLEKANEEFEKELENGYQEAYDMLVAERAKNESLSVDIYGEYDQKLQEMKEYIVDKVDAFLQFKGTEIYEQAKRDILNDPRMAEHKVALDQIVEVASKYLSHEDYAFATSTKLESAQKNINDLQAQIKLMEARNIRLSHDNTKLNETVRQSQDVITESKNNEKNARTQKAKNVSGRGKVETETVEVIAEHKQQPAQKDNATEDTYLLEGLDRETINLLAGTQKPKE